MAKKALSIIGIFGGLLMATVCHGFSLLGPPVTPATTWQVPAIGYQRPGDIGGPVTPGEEYRWTLPMITYAFDDSFLSYFGQDGITAVEEALAVINNLGPVSNFSPDLGEFPTEALRLHQTAASLGIIDVKTTTLSTVLELLGLADAQRWVYSLRQRAVSGMAPNLVTNYLVIQRNYDPVTVVPSQSINGNLWFYQIFDPIAPDNWADAVEIAAVAPDPTTQTLPIASSFLFSGVFATGLSRDDAGGLRYIYSATNRNVETLLPGITLASNGVVGNVVSPWIPYFGITNIFTNVFGTTNIVGTNGVFATALRPGMETITFVRTDFDSFLGQTFVPITNIFTDVYISNNAAVLQRVQRITTQPDLLFTADLVAAVGGLPVLLSRGVNFINNDALNGQSVLAGPGVLSGPARISFSRLLPAIIDDSLNFFNGPLGTVPTGAWGSFGEAPGPENIIVFPVGMTVELLQDMFPVPVPP
jgi:hypothetical protein